MLHIVLFIVQVNIKFLLKMDFQQLIKLKVNKIYHFFIIIKILKIHQFIYLLI